MNATILIAAMMLAQSPDDDARAALALAQSAKKEQPKPKMEEESFDEKVYARAANEAIRLGKTLVVFVGVKERGIPGAVCCGVDTYAGDGSPRIMMWNKQRGRFLVFDASETVQSLSPWVEGFEGVSRQATPFDKRRGEVSAQPDADQDIPQLRDLLKGMERYKSTDKTQTTFRRWSGYIAPSSRLELPNKWVVPGHLDGVDGWSSTLYRTKGVKASEFLVRQDPSDGSSAVTWGRSYPDNTAFVDVLRNADGKVFEVRMAEKADGRWDRFIKFRDAEARPHGYVRPTTEQCAACHAQAGRSEYGGAAIPGGDTVISDGYYVLEHGGNVQGGFGTNLGR